MEDIFLRIHAKPGEAGVDPQRYAPCAMPFAVFTFRKEDRSMKKKFMGVIVVALVFLIFGLWDRSHAQKYGGTFTLGMYADILTPDLHRTIGNPTAQMGMLVAESLIDWNEECDFVPSLAESWRLSPDASEYTFFLRKGVLFHNGRELTAEEVKKSYDHLIDEKTASPRRAEFNNIKRIEAVDKYTVRFYLKGPDAGFLATLQPTNAFVTAPESFESKPPFPIGTGPFEFVEWKPRQYVKLKRFKNYWMKDKNGKQLPYVDEVILKPITDDTVRYTALRTGDVDWVWTLPFEQIPEIKRRSPAGIDASVRGGVRWIHIELNYSKGPTKDLRVRQAIAHAIDKKAIMEGLTWGIAPPESQIFAPGSQWYVQGIKDPYQEPDLAKARQLLKEAGYEKGFQLNTIVRNETFIMNIATLAQANLKKVGIDLQLEILDRATHEARQGKNQFEVNPSHLTFVPDPDGLYNIYFHSKSAMNFVRYDNPEYDKVVEEGRRTVDISRRKEVYRKALELLNKDIPHIFLGHYPIAQASRTYLIHMKSYARGDISWSDGGVSHAWIDK